MFILFIIICICSMRMNVIKLGVISHKCRGFPRIGDPSVLGGSLKTWNLFNIYLFFVVDRSSRVLGHITSHAHFLHGVSRFGWVEAGCTSFSFLWLVWFQYFECWKHFSSVLSVGSTFPVFWVLETLSYLPYVFVFVCTLCFPIVFSAGYTADSAKHY